MSEPRALVYADVRGEARRVGRLWTSAGKGREAAGFQYDDEWLAARDSFALDPALPLGGGAFHTGGGRPLFGALDDCSPDRWGRSLVARAERRLARDEGRAPRTLFAADYLLGVSDEVRQGALRFAAVEGGPFLAASEGVSVPPLVYLPRLLAATDRVVADEESAEDLRLLLAPGGSLGGAWPKASVRDQGGDLLIAKFPALHYEYNVVRWEAVALALARRAGIPVSDWRIETVLDRHVLLLRRFDREGRERIPFLSAMSMLGAKDGETHSYLEIADALRGYGAAATTDLKDLWRRIVFGVLISNTDDHLRNHGFLWEGSAGWRLSPAYDLNPTPTDLRPRILQTAIGEDEDLSASLDLALAVARSFGLKLGDAKAIAGEVGAVVGGWRQEAARIGIREAEIDRMVSAFEHEDLEAARRL
jgi:serine/threonine-protein kinase HipA